MKNRDAKVAQIGEKALSKEGYVTAIDILLGLGILTEENMLRWRKGQVPYLERVVDSNLSKISSHMKCFRQWATKKGLKPSKTVYRAKLKGRRPTLRFSKSGKPAIEAAYATHFVSPELSKKDMMKPLENKSENVLDKNSKKSPEEPQERELRCIFILAPRPCSECGEDLTKGELVLLEEDHSLCLCCADIDHLVFLPSGNTALTRRSRKHSDLSIVVTEFSRSRKRYERQGVLVTQEGLDKAEEECLSDEDRRAKNRELAKKRREKDDVVLVEKTTLRIKKLFPGCPEPEAHTIAQHATVRGSGRVGRSAAGRDAEDRPITLAVQAHVRHVHTDYDSLLMKHGDRSYARQLVSHKIEAVMERWRGE